MWVHCLFVRQGGRGADCYSLAGLCRVLLLNKVARNCLGGLVHHLLGHDGLLLL